MSDCFPGDVLVDILVRLPVKLLIQVRSVCKSWLSLISTPAFMAARQKWKQQNGEDLVLLFRYFSKWGDNGEHYRLCHNSELSGETFQEIEFPFKSENEFFRIVGYCKGLMCLADDLSSYTNCIILWNPSIRKSLTLPSLGGNVDLPAELGSNNCALGFGLDAVNNDFKVVRIKSFTGHNRQMFTTVDIYSLSTRLWREIDVSGFPYHIVNYYRSQAFCQGAAHWLAETMWEGQKQISIMSFDMVSESFHEFKIPYCLSGLHSWFLHVTVIQESLSIFQYRYSWNDTCCIWVMEKYGDPESWRRIWSLSPSQELEKPIGLRENDVVLGSVSGESLVYQDPVKQWVKDIEMNGSLVSWMSLYLNTYEESLVLLDEKRVPLIFDDDEGGVST